MIRRLCALGKQDGAASVEFAILLPIWLMVFFAFLDYGWFLTNLVVLENAVSSGARAGVKVKYWLEPGDDGYQDPGTVAKQVVINSFLTSRQLEEKDIQVNLIRYELGARVVAQPEEKYQYLEVKVARFAYGPLTGYLPEAMMPQHVSALSLTAFP